MVQFEFILTYKNGSKLKSTTSGPFCHFHVKAHGNMSSHGRPGSRAGRGAQVCEAAGAWGQGGPPRSPPAPSWKRRPASSPLLWKDGFFDLSSASVSETSAMREQSRELEGPPETRLLPVSAVDATRPTPSGSLLWTLASRPQHALWDITSGLATSAGPLDTRS